ncbi:hypothetical protein GCM10027280_24630 [Micromonospora polyrhachis]|uniref:Uncharacterized protein n=1 Tax=Micromonospora polyrhachis TaxID=1282883 RepID=A0A7W7ST88_9ACTN|nr:hypothetical protein [Micromonospora polyrhachis]MBB4960443.1 hypothetical protein [Micromonospora polyrhachis]
MVTPAADGSLLLPVGHYVAGQGQEHWVRIGARTTRIRDDETANVWWLAHGLTDQATPWTAQAVREHAGLPADRFAEAMAELRAAGLLCEVDPADDVAAERFARRHRLHPLQPGLGAHPQLPGWYAIGLPDLPAAVVVPPFAFEVWQWAPALDSLWHACEAVAVLEDEAADPDDPAAADDAEPLSVLTDLLYCLHPLLAGHAAYLDERIGDPV